MNDKELIKAEPLKLKLIKRLPHGPETETLTKEELVKRMMKYKLRQNMRQDRFMGI